MSSTQTHTRTRTNTHLQTYNSCTYRVPLAALLTWPPLLSPVNSCSHTCSHQHKHAHVHKHTQGALGCIAHMPPATLTPHQWAHAFTHKHTHTLTGCPGLHRSHAACYSHTTPMGTRCSTVRRTDQYSLSPIITR